MRPILLIFLSLLSLPAFAGPTGDLPRELRPFISANATALEYVQGDLDRDGDSDWLLVVQWQSKPDAEEEWERQNLDRELLILLRGANGKLRIAKRSTRAVFCSQCGGVFGDPYVGVEAGRGRFIIRHYGGSNWRWGYTHVFAYSKRDATWQLVRAEEEEFHTGEPDKIEKKVHTPPRDFGKIAIDEFDPMNYLGVGPK